MWTHVSKDIAMGLPTPRALIGFTHIGHEALDDGNSITALLVDYIKSCFLYSVQIADSYSVQSTTIWRISIPAGMCTIPPNPRLSRCSIRSGRDRDTSLGYVSRQSRCRDVETEITAWAIISVTGSRKYARTGVKLTWKIYVSAGMPGQSQKVVRKAQEYCTLSLTSPAPISF